MATADQILLQFGLIFLAGLVAGQLARWIRVPDIVLYLLAGIILGPSGLGLFHLATESATSGLILTFGAAFMLYEGGREVGLAVLAQVWRTVTLLSTTGVLVTALPVAFAADTLLHVPFLPALLLAAVLAPTDPATIVPIFKQVRLLPRLAETARSESAFNDATGSVLVISLLGMLTAGDLSVGEVAVRFLWLLGGGLGIGLVVGFLASALVAHGTPIPRLFGDHEAGPVMSLVIIITAYLAAELSGASGFMAVFMAGIVSGNKPFFGMSAPERQERLHDDVFSVTALVMRMLIFEILGSSVNFAVIGAHLWPLLGVVATLMFVGRPLAVLLSVLPDRAVGWTRNEALFLMWVRETGVIPAALAGILAAEGAPLAGVIGAAVFTAILATLLIQASTTGAVARRLGVLARPAGERAPDGSH